MTSMALFVRLLLRLERQLRVFSVCHKPRMYLDNVWAYFIREISYV